MTHLSNNWRMHGLSLNPTVALKLKYSRWGYSNWLNALLTVRSQNLSELNLGCTLSEEYVRQLSEIVTTCKQLRVLKVELISDNSESFFHALSDNQSLRELLLAKWQYSNTLINFYNNFRHRYSRTWK